MENATHTLATLADEVLAQFHNGERKSDDTGRMIRCLPHEGLPGFVEWHSNLAHAAHADEDGQTMLPDDWRYEMIEDALRCISEANDDDSAQERADEHEAPIYNHERLRWLASHLWRPSYCDQAEEEIGTPDGVGLLDRVAMGYLYEFRMVFRSVLSSIKAELERREESEAVS